MQTINSSWKVKSFFMFLMYVDESGDCGLIQNGSPTRFFALSAMIIHENKWNPLLLDLINFRRNLKIAKGLKMREEIHAVEFLTRPGALVRIKKNDRLDILKKCLDWVAAHNDISIITVVVDKQGKKKPEQVFESAWERLIQRFENTIQRRNFPDSSPQIEERGMIIPDNTDNKKLKALIRRMRRHNIVPNNAAYYPSGYRNLTLSYVIEDPFLKDSADSYFHQITDVIAYFARQKFEPNAYVRKKGATTFYDRLLPVINPHVTSGNLHIIRG